MTIIHQIKKLDAVVGQIAVSLFSLPAVHKINSPVTSILFIRPGGIGDAVLLAPSINFIKIHFPNICITIIAERRNCEVFSLIPHTDKVFCYDRPVELAQALLGKYDIVIDTEQWYRLSAVVARLVSAPVKIGFDTNERRRMFTHGILYDMGAYEADNFLSLLKPLDVGVLRDTGAIATLSLPSQSVFKAACLLKPLYAEPFIAIFPGASVSEKRWGNEHFRTVAKRLSKNGYRVVIVGGPGDRSDGDTIVDDTGLNLAGMTTLAETAAVIARSCLLISGDSGVLHIAAGLNIPTISLFGPSSSAKWAPKGERHIVINHHLPCSPCSKFGTIPLCPINSRCIRDITPDEVISAIGRLLPQPP